MVFALFSKRYFQLAFVNLTNSTNPSFIPFQRPKRSMKKEAAKSENTFRRPQSVIALLVVRLPLQPTTPH
jgi:hypothetical protein